VFDSCLEERIPIAVTMAGGYAQKVEDTVDIHFQTVKRALDCQKEWIRRDGWKTKNYAPGALT
jgi:hypothetical protein